MHREPPERVSAAPTERPVRFDYRWDWLANQTAWEGGGAFYERALGGEGQMVNGADSSSSLRPAALYFATNIRDMAGGYSATTDRGGFVSVEY